MIYHQYCFSESFYLPTLMFIPLNLHSCVYVEVNFVKIFVYTLVLKKINKKSLFDKLVSPKVLSTYLNTCTYFNVD